MSNDKIPIGKYRCSRTLGGEQFDYVTIKFKNGVGKNVKDGDIITLDMIEPYESLAVRKMADYLLESFFVSKYGAIVHAREIVDLVHEAEDADE